MASSLPNADQKVDLPWPYPLQPVAEPGTETVRAEGPGLAGLVWRGSLLTIVTLGIYRFWYKTDLRRWYWRHTSVAGSAFEYRGTGRELLLGFLFALAVLVPIYLVVALGGLFAGEVAGVALNVLFAFVFLLLVQYGAYRSRRYRLTRTVWRGLRFDQTGSAWAYAGLSFAWLLATILTLGLLFPLMRRSLEGYRIRHTRFGTAEGQFAVHALTVLSPWMVLMGPLLACFLWMFLDLIASLSARRTVIPGAGAIFLGVMGVFWAFFSWPYYRVREFSIFAEGTAIGPVSFRSNARPGRAYAIYGKFMLIASVASSALGVVVGALAAAAGGFVQMQPGRPGFILAIVALLPVYLGSVLLFGVLKELFMNRPFWQLLAGTLTVQGLDHLDDVLSRSVSDEAATGEGFADALDFGGV